MNQKEIHESAGAMILLVVNAVGRYITPKQAALQIDEIIKWRDENEKGENPG